MTRTRLESQIAHRINVNEPYELRRWCAHFGVTEQQLRDAVKKVGPMVADVKRHLGK